MKYIKKLIIAGGSYYPSNEKKVIYQEVVEEAVVQETEFIGNLVSEGIPSIPQ